MARLIKDLVTAREKYAYEAFRANPEKTIKDVQADLFTHDDLGHRYMSPNRIYPIRDAAVAGLPLPSKPPKKVKAAAVDVKEEGMVAVDAAALPTITNTALVVNETVIDAEFTDILPTIPAENIANLTAEVV
jgi:hypothetical protein